MRWTLLVGLLCFAAGVAAGDVGQIKAATGAVFLERQGERLPAAVGMPVQESDSLVTGADGSAGVTFSDNSLLSVGPGSVLTIERYAFDSTTHRGHFDAALKKGMLAVVSGKMVKQSPDAMRVRTPSSIMGVRGTEFVVKVTEPGS
jgi:hypothetical protein